MKYIQNAAEIQLEGRAYVDVSKGTASCVVYGPYAELATGKFRVTFDIRSNERGHIADVDIVIDGGNTVVAKQALQSGKTVVPFELDRNAVVEYRVHGIGKKFQVAYDRPLEVQIDNADDVAFLTLTGDVPDFVKQNYSQIRRLAELGVAFDIGDEMSAVVNGIHCKVHSVEELQLFTELFFINEYTFQSPVDCVAIDIGMNVGLTSLLLAANPKVKAVHSYEPFKRPFGRALDNIAMNPSLARKITANQLGLADRTEIVDVRSQEINTVGVSITGTNVGDPETIQIVPADILKPIILAAKDAGQWVVMKVDCEGSEFAIFENLEQADLFRHVDVMMIEWHKWWDKTKTQADLIRPMVAAGLFVFDRTNPDNPMAGSLYAVRVRQ